MEADINKIQVGKGTKIVFEFIFGEEADFKIKEEESTKNKNLSRSKEKSESRRNMVKEINKELLEIAKGKYPIGTYIDGYKEPISGTLILENGIIYAPTKSFHRYITIYDGEWAKIITKPTNELTVGKYYNFKYNNQTTGLKILIQIEKIGQGKIIYQADICRAELNQFESNNRISVSTDMLMHYSPMTEAEIREFELRRPIEIKVGSCYSLINSFNSKFTMVCTEIKDITPNFLAISNDGVIIYDCLCSDLKKLIPLKDDSELQELLYKRGKKYNHEAKKVERCRVKKGELFYFVNTIDTVECEREECSDWAFQMFENYNYFHSKESAEKYRKELKCFIENYNKQN